MGLNKAFTIEIDGLLNMRAALGAAKSRFVTERLALVRPAVCEKIKHIEAALAVAGLAAIVLRLAKGSAYG